MTKLEPKKRGLSFLFFVAFILFFNIMVEATEKKIEPPFSRGTLNLAIGNHNGVVVATDSRATLLDAEGQWQGEQDDHQKLFKISNNIVATIAGYGSGDVPSAKFTVASSAVIGQYINDLKRYNHVPTYPEVVSGLSFAMNFYLTSIENIRKFIGDKVDTGIYEFQLLIVGTYGNQRLITKIILKSQVKDNILTSKIDTIEQTEINDSFVFKSAGVAWIAEDILNNPEKYESIPAIANYANHIKKDKGVNLSCAEMRKIAETVLEIAANRSARIKSKWFHPIGGPHQLAISENGNFDITLPILRPSPPPPMRYNLFTAPNMGGNIGFRSIPSAIAFDTKNMIMMFIGGNFHDGAIKIDNQYFFGNTFKNCSIVLDSNVFHFDKSNQIQDCELILGVNVDRTFPSVISLKSNFKWKRMREEEGIRE